MGTFRFHGIGDQAQQGCSRRLDSLDCLLGQVAIHPIQGYQQDQAIHVLGGQHGIRQAQHGRGVVDDQIKLARLADLLGHLMHPGRAEQPGGIGRPPARGDHRPAGMVLHRLHGIGPVDVVFGEDVGEAHQVVEAEPVVHLGLAHVGVNQQHPFAHLREGFRQQHVDQGFAFVGNGAGEGNGPQGPVGIEEAQAGEEVAEGLLIEKTLVAREGFGGCSRDLGPSFEGLVWIGAGWGGV